MRRIWFGLVVLVSLAAACTAAPADVASSAATSAAPKVSPATTVVILATTTTFAPAPTTTVPATTTTASPFARPEWLGTRLLPLRADGFAEPQPTPPEMVNRQFATIDVLPPPGGDTFEHTLGQVPADVVARSSWNEDCPVTLEELRYLTVSHLGFDGAFHTGEIIVNAAVAEQVVEIFQTLHEARFPIEQMRVITAEEIDAHPTGDWNDTTSFVCRDAVGSGSWSQHAYGLAIDINPFHNPYLKGDLVIPELASAYLDREDVRSGMIIPGDATTLAFAEIGWGWGGEWSSLVDFMHFSRNGR